MNNRLIPLTISSVLPAEGEAPGTASVMRRKERHSNVTISLRHKGKKEWEWIKVYDWNEEGFNFFHDGEIEDTTLTSRQFLKKSIYIQIILRASR